MLLAGAWQDVILDHYRDPIGRGLAEAYDVAVSQRNPACADELTVRIRLDRTSGSEPILAQLTHTGRGCSISQASASMMAELVSGLPVRQVADLDDRVGGLLRGQQLSAADADRLGDVFALGAVVRFPARVRCAALAWAALREALRLVSGAADTDGQRTPQWDEKPDREGPL